MFHRLSPDEEAPSGPAPVRTFISPNCGKCRNSCSSKVLEWFLNVQVVVTAAGWTHRIRPLLPSQLDSLQSLCGVFVARVTFSSNQAAEDQPLIKSQLADSLSG